MAILATSKWEPHDPAAWAGALGLAEVRLFGSSRRGNVPPGQHALMLDGKQLSFSLSCVDHHEEIEDDAVSWAWSSHVRHAVLIDQRSDRLFLRRWDEPSRIRKFRLPQSASAAQELVHVLREAGRPVAPTVVAHVLEAFRYIRQDVQDSVEAVRVLHGLLLLSREMIARTVDGDKVRQSATLRDAFAQLPTPLQKTAGLTNIVDEVDKLSAERLLSHFIDPEPHSNCRLDADLLLRHASSELYQEAHLEVERNPQESLWGLSAVRSYGVLPSEVRYTPTNLVRSLVEQAVLALGSTSSQSGDDTLVALDPACGSGVFLAEVAREYAERGIDRKLRLVGFDKSPAASAIAHSSLQGACVGLSDVEIEISTDDALARDWQAADLVLMNPPFSSIEDLKGKDRENVNRVLGPLRSGRTDKALAFLLKAWRALKPGGVLAVVLPSSLLNSRSGRSVRKEIDATANILTIGRFEGYAYFRNSMVETSFLVLRKEASPKSGPVRVVIGAKDHADSALRALRAQHDELDVASEEVEVYVMPRDRALPRGMWYPRRQKVVTLLTLLDDLNLPKLSDLLEMHQGMRTGLKSAFILTERELLSLPKREHVYFRPVAGQGSIVDGRLDVHEFAFYPYSHGGLLLPTIDDVRKSAATYYERWLKPQKSRLEQRQKIQEWWLPTWPRKWQFATREKIVSTYSGGSGSFAFDYSGEYVVGQGFGFLGNLLWEDDEGEAGPQAKVPWAYMALLNSAIFEQVAASYSSRLAGGQLLFDIKYIGQAPLPDLRKDDPVCRAALGKLARLGKKIQRDGVRRWRDDIDTVVSDLYGIPDGYFDSDLF